MATVLRAVAGKLDAVQAQLTRFLKPLGYRKRGRTTVTRGRACGTSNLQMAGYPDRDDQETCKKLARSLTYGYRLTKLVSTTPRLAVYC
jgi:hypothetical protein